MSSIAEVKVAEAQLRAAMLASDVTRLGELLSDALHFTNQDGLRLTKADDLAAHRSGLLAITRIDVRGVPEIRLLGDTAIVCTTAHMVGRYADQDFGGTFAYTRIWHRTEARWRIEAAHCSAIAPTD
ncbi:nuclear transport factor 2 family protein [Sphingobium sp. 3R8]|uniref:nuclear transport factor 2 family protein n=1 Tax=Sphingobium sp. 3R8 TaxID=2874921 RepID=UPI001CCDE7F3|nr:nuclear transport factor 2 family protein [Sphingobium sp. 3R8]MBZ9649790.1 nuclear transport factor 2 family protein [Sphingobium sp. 3R8]